jgi:polysaccharide export outer membrane protein
MSAVVFNCCFKFRGLALGAIALVVAACSGGPSLESPSEQSFSQKGGSTIQVSNPAAASKMEQMFAASAMPTGDVTNEDYRIAPLDVLEVSVFGVEDLTRTVQVSSSGMVNLPLIRTIRASGQTASELERQIAQKLEAGYLQAPQVSVFIKEYNSQRITIDGAVKNPGIYPIKGKTSLLQAIAMAAGLQLVADRSAVMVFRTVGNRRMGARFDIEKIRSGQQSDPMLQAGDIVMVDESAARTTLRDIKEVLPLSGLFTMLLL